MFESNVRVHLAGMPWGLETLVMMLWACRGFDGVGLEGSWSWSCQIAGFVRTLGHYGQANRFNSKWTGCQAKWRGAEWYQGVYSANRKQGIEDRSISRQSIVDPFDRIQISQWLVISEHCPCCYDEETSGLSALILQSCNACLTALIDATFTVPCNSHRVRKE